MRVVLMLVMLLVPSLVHANQLRVTSYDMDEAGGTVHLASDLPIGESWIRVEGRAVRVWFPRIVDIARFDHVREPGEAIRSVMLRPGASDTAVLKVELGVAKHIDPSDVEIVRTGTDASVRIRVPGMEPAPPETTTSAVTAAPAAATVAPAPIAREVEPEAEAPAAQPVEAPAVAQPAAPVENKPEPLSAAADFAPDRQPTLVYLLVVCAVLGAVLAGLQLFVKRRPRQRPEIEVLGARRLGHRQELVIVRALGSDHLLLCTAGRAERVASTPSPTALPADTLKGSESSQAGGIGLISRLSSHHRLRKLLDNVERESADELPAEDDNEPQHAFGAELFSATRKQQRAAAALPARGRQSESVAGISRLRKRAAS